MQEIRELTVISGKGGTGKTSIVSSFAALAKNPGLSDCDVDAPDLHIVLKPEIKKQEPFIGGKKARIIKEKCNGCNKCLEVCRFDAVIRSTDDTGSEYIYWIDPIACEGCGVCAYFCPEQAVEYKESINGDLYISEMRFGPMVHAR